MFIRKQDEERCTDCDGRHQVRKKCHTIYIARPPASAVLRDRISDQGTDRSGKQGTADSDEQCTCKCMPDRIVVEDAVLSVHTVLGDILLCDPPLRRQVAQISCIEEAVIARVRKEGLKCEGEDRENTCKECQDDHHDTDRIFSDFSKVHL